MDKTLQFSLSKSSFQAILAQIHEEHIHSSVLVEHKAHCSIINCIVNVFHMIKILLIYGIHEFFINSEFSISYYGYRALRFSVLLNFYGNITNKRVQFYPHLIMSIVRNS